MLTGTFLSRFTRQIDYAGPDDCWIWNGATQVRSDGQRVGRIWSGAPSRRHLLSHRAALMIHEGADRPDQDVHHLCGDALCCNPRHLEWVKRDHHRAHHNHTRSRHGPRRTR